MSHSLVLVSLFGAAAMAGEGLLPFDSRWHYPHYLGFRPAAGQVCDVNPPRFSWAYVPDVLPAGAVPLTEFTFQISRTPDFAAPEVNVHTPLNFFNALPVLADTTWHWRVGYGIGTEAGRWSEVRSFSFAPGAVAWDRTPILGAAAKLAALPHPRLTPPGGDWQGWRTRLEANPRTAPWLKATLEAADKTTRRPWWQDFPTSDRKGESPFDEKAWANVAAELARTAFAYRLTGEERYLGAKDPAVALAGFPKGGLSSPEYHGASVKWPTQVTESLAQVYDWLYPELTPAERGALLGSIEWRLRATYLEKASWRSGDAVSPSGVALYCQSHPYENFMWSMPGVLLTAGDLPLATDLVDLCLHYLTGVTSAHGPDEGWNEGLAYGGWKGDTMLDAARLVDVLLPELRLGVSPYFLRLGEWYAHLYPLGIQRLAFGDYASDPESKRGNQRNIFRALTWLTGNGRMRTRADALIAEVGDGASSKPWLDLLCADARPLPEPLPEATRALFPEAGWVMVSTRPPSNREAFQEAVGMIFQCRPRGGYSHSYRAENDFVWHAYGQALSAGGGYTAYPDPHARHSLSHNVILVNGSGQEWNPKAPKRPFCGRLLAYREGAGFVHWAGDATYAYQTVPGLLRWHRHVVFVDGTWFAVYDDLAMAPDADPARFSWLFHVAPDVPLDVDAAGPALRYRMGDVHALVALAGPADAIEVADLQLRDGFRNPITGHDMYEETAAALVRKGRTLPESSWMRHNVWITNREPARQWSFLTALVAWREGDTQPRVSFGGSARVTVGAGAGERTVSFDPRRPGDVTIDLEGVREHASRAR